MLSGNKVQEALLLLQKDDERIVTGRSYWRPSMYRDVRAAMQSTNFGRRISTNWDALMSTVKEEYDIKADYMKKNAKPLYKALVSIKRDIMTTYEEIIDDVMDMYNRNEFHIKDMCQWFKKAGTWTKYVYHKLIQYNFI
jgi:hypothetical protein